MIVVYALLGGIKQFDVNFFYLTESIWSLFLFTFVVILGTTLMSWATYKYIEKPCIQYTECSFFHCSHVTDIYLHLLGLKTPVNGEHPFELPIEEEVAVRDGVLLQKVEYSPGPQHLIHQLLIHHETFFVMRSVLNVTYIFRCSP